MSTLPMHLRFLQDLAAEEPGDLAEFFPQTASGELQPRRGEALFDVDGDISFIGNTDGTMVPITAEHLEPMPENIWNGRKFATLVDAIASGLSPIVYPGYADVMIEDGEVVAQVRDGNHRTFAPIANGSEFSWVMLSDRTVQDLQSNDALYKAVRAAQKALNAPLFKRKPQTKVKSGALAGLLAAERLAAELDEQIATYQRAMLKKHGPASGPYSLKQQQERPQLFWRRRLGELSEERGHDWTLKHVYGTKEGRAAQAAQELRMGQDLYTLRKSAGLQHGERLDPVTGKVIRP